MMKTVENSDGNIEPATVSSKPLPRFRRASDAPPLVLQARDLAMLEDLWRYRVLTTSQLELLRSSDEVPAWRFVSRLTLTRRLKLLFHGRYVRRLARPSVGGMKEPVYLLDREGARALSRLHGEVAFRAPSQLPKLVALEHALAINGFRVCLTFACARTRGRAAEFRLLQWQNSEESKFSVMLPGDERKPTSIHKETPHHREVPQRKVTLLPDGFFQLRVPTQANSSQRLFYYLEVDLGSEVSRVITDKCRAYYACWQSGGFAQKHNVSPKVGFRVLFVAPTAKRAQTILGAIGKLGAGQGMFWVALQDQITPDGMLRPIWQSAQDQEKRADLAGQFVSEKSPTD